MTNRRKRPKEHPVRYKLELGVYRGAKSLMNVLPESVRLTLGRWGGRFGQGPDLRCKEVFLVRVLHVPKQLFPDCLICVLQNNYIVAARDDSAVLPDELSFVSTVSDFSRCLWCFATGGVPSRLGWHRTRLGITLVAVTVTLKVQVRVVGTPRRVTGDNFSSLIVFGATALSAARLAAARLAAGRFGGAVTDAGVGGVRLLPPPKKQSTTQEVHAPILG